MVATGVNGPKLAELDYRVIRTIGTGAGSTVLLVADKKLGTQYALKIVVDGREVYQTQQPLDSAGLPAQLSLPHRTSLFWGSHDAELRFTEMKLTPVVAGRPAPNYLMQSVRFDTGTSTGPRPGPGANPCAADRGCSGRWCNCGSCS